MSIEFDFFSVVTFLFSTMRRRKCGWIKLTCDSVDGRMDELEVLVVSPLHAELIKLAAGFNLVSMLNNFFRCNRRCVI